MSDVILAHARAIARELVEDGTPQERVIVLPNGLPDAWFANDVCRTGVVRQALPERLRERTLVGLVGAVEPGKGHHILLDAIPLVTERLRQVAFIFVGNHANVNYYDHLLRQAAQRGVADAVHFLGETPNTRGVLADLDILVQASFTEGQPLGVMEAMAVGTPVVATAVGGTLELVENGRTGVLVPSGDTVSLALAIQRLIIDPGERLRLSLSARDHARKAFSIGPVVDDLESTYWSLLPPNSQRRGHAAQRVCPSEQPRR